MDAFWRLERKAALQEVGRRRAVDAKKEGTYNEEHGALAQIEKMGEVEEDGGFRGGKDLKCNNNLFGKIRQR